MTPSVVEKQSDTSAIAGPRSAIVLFLLVAAITAAIQVSTAKALYTYRHGFISAVFATEARNFSQLGIVKLGGVPVDNNPPIGNLDAYIHWPPAFPLLLSLWFNAFGISETSAHLMMLAIEAITAALVFAVAREWLGVAGGALAGFFWLTMPAVVHYGHIVEPENLSILLSLVAVFAFTRKLPWIVGAAAFCAVCVSWESALLPFGLWVAAKLSGEHKDKRSALFCSSAVALSLLLVWATYIYHSPALFRDAIQSGLFRMGLSHAYSSGGLVNAKELYLGLGESIGRICVNFPRMLGLGSAALVLLAITRPPRSQPLIFGLGLPWLLWCILMRNHVAAHDIEMLLVGPLAAMGLAWTLLGAIKGKGRFKGWLVLSAAVLIVAVQPWVFGTEKSPEDPQQIIGFSLGLAKATPANAIILSPLISAVPLYYSERHIVRYVWDEDAARKILPAVRLRYPGSPIYWATPLYVTPWVAIKELQRHPE